ncbi:hypothetical protein H257_15818 [Aphanomyces astaci]|uniref:ABC transporter domain-containing protein n=1 Tax=Aphanomyces astaci TaxID=112090 RepID=W4FKS3_APHAT|nr:hypothetical protein H257_15818 [Aphanomyces astaci]ETV68055.1 hypothetical protein H257_15818 [Aphanomyces astaci]|eukprot:XP_009842354.1 hypothetical protein H257_15818 [Aphanomyces astaci]
MQLWTEPKRIMLGTFVYPDPDTTIGYVMIGVGVLSAAVGYVLVLGPPQCVKAAFLKTLAGVFHYKGGGTLSPHISGSVSYNGLSPRDIHVEDIATFVGQTDEHIPTLTVLETFEFTDACRGPSNSTEWQRSTPAMVHALGLATCAHTRMGNAMIRGISGEQRRRVSVGQMMTGQTTLLLLDEFTTGDGHNCGTQFDDQAVGHVHEAPVHALVLAVAAPARSVCPVRQHPAIERRPRVLLWTAVACVPYFHSIGYIRPDRVDAVEFNQQVSTVLGKLTRDPTFPGAVPGSPLDFQTAFQTSPFASALVLPTRIATAKRRQRQPIVAQGLRLCSNSKSSRYNGTTDSMKFAWGKVQCLG